MGQYLDPINIKYFEMMIPVGDIGRIQNQDANARCPICGDSKTKRNSKRFHLYTKSSFDGDVLHCFNGDCDYSGNMYSYLKEYRPDLYTSYVKEKKGESFQRLKNQKESVSVLDKNFNRPTKGTPALIFKMPSEFKKITESDIKFRNYVDTRNINYDDIYSVDQIIKVNEKEIALMNMLVIPLWFDKTQNEIYGFQCRSITEKFFYTYIPEENQGFKVWNWYNLTKSLPVYIFESYFDARSSGLPENQICAALGADLNAERLSELKEPVFCFDNQGVDATAKIKSIKFLEEGNKVFVWPDTKIKDFNAILVAGAGFQQISNMITKGVKQGIMGLIPLKLKR